MSKSIEEKFQTDIEYRIYRIRHFATKHGWKETAASASFILFEKEEMSLQVYLPNVQIISCVHHPQYGRTVLLRKGNFTQQIIESIFRNPRVHMNREKVKSEQCIITHPGPLS